MSDANGACINPQLTGQTTSGATASGTVTTSCRCSNSTTEDAGDVNPATSGGSSTAATLSAVTSPTALWPPHGIGGGEGGGGGSDEGLSKRIEEMEEEQEELTNSLMEMTSHFAKVQTYFLFVNSVTSKIFYRYLSLTSLECNGLFLFKSI